MSIWSGTFRELTPEFDFSPVDLQETPLLASSSFHLLGAPAMCSTYVEQILRLRARHSIRDSPLLVWEPEPRTSLTRNLSSTVSAASKINVLSPNHLELRRLFIEHPVTPRPTTIEIEEYGKQLLDLGIGPNGSGLLIVCAAELGCMVVSRELSPRWFPAYYGPQEDMECRAKQGEEVEFNRAVVDPTGAGNAFLGAFTIEYAASGDLVEAICQAMVAESFTVQQIAFPTKGEDETGQTETWNGEAARERLDLYKKRLDIDN